MPIVTILTHHPGSGSAALLANALRGAGFTVSTASANQQRSTRGHRVIINYGVSTNPMSFRQGSVTWSNTTRAVGNCADKIQTFSSLRTSDVPTLEFRLNRAPMVSGDVARWLEQDGKVVVRNVVNGHSGQGLEIIRTGNPLPQRAPLYTRYFRKDTEYRVHVAFGRVILIQQKRRENDRDQNDLERLVRTHANGWIFSIQDLSCDQRGYRDALCDIALRAAASVGANHCGVDILVRHGNPNDLRVVELNSACAMRADSTLNAYTTAFSEWIRSL